MTIDVSNEVQAAYDQIVDSFVAENHGSRIDSLQQLMQRLITHVGTDGCVLDVGCGTGRDVQYFETHRVQAVGMDLSMNMLAYAAGCVSSPVVQMNMRDLAFADHTFDGIYSCASLLHIPKAQVPACLREMKRILKPEGMLIIRLQQGDGEVWNEGYMEGVKRFFARYTEAEMCAMLNDCGLDVQDVHVDVAGRTWLSFVCLHSV
ncbi:MAG: class I SAM-dependent methyltransferase [Chloroflexota bacterium]